MKKNMWAWRVYLLLRVGFLLLWLSPLRAPEAPNLLSWMTMYEAISVMALFCFVSRKKFLPLLAWKGLFAVFLSKEVVALFALLQTSTTWRGGTTLSQVELILHIIGGVSLPALIPVLGLGIIVILMLDVPVIFALVRLAWPSKINDHN